MTKQIMQLQFVEFGEGPSLVVLDPFFRKEQSLRYYKKLFTGYHVRIIEVAPFYWDEAQLSYQSILASIEHWLLNHVKVEKVHLVTMGLSVKMAFDLAQHCSNCFDSMTLLEPLILSRETAYSPLMRKFVKIKTLRDLVAFFKTQHGIMFFKKAYYWARGFRIKDHFLTGTHFLDIGKLVYRLKNIYQMEDLPFQVSMYKRFKVVVIHTHSSPWMLKENVANICEILGATQVSISDKALFDATGVGKILKTYIRPKVKAA